MGRVRPPSDDHWMHHSPDGQALGHQLGHDRIDQKGDVVLHDGQQIERQGRAVRPLGVGHAQAQSIACARRRLVAEGPEVRGQGGEILAGQAGQIAGRIVLQQLVEKVLLARRRPAIAREGGAHRAGRKRPRLFDLRPIHGHASSLG